MASLWRQLSKDQKVLVCVVAGVIVLALLVHVADGTSGTAAVDGPPTLAATSVVFVAPPTAVPTAVPVFLNHGGAGQWTSEQFSPPADWQLRYSYSCAAFGDKGNFIVTVYGPGGTQSLSGVNELGWGRSGSTSVHDVSGPGTYVAVNSECDWHIKAAS